MCTQQGAETETAKQKLKLALHWKQVQSDWLFQNVCIPRLLCDGLIHLFFVSNSSVSFNETARADAVLGYLIAFLVLLSTVKLWHLLRLNPKLHMITSTLRRAWGDISGFITVIAIMFLAYSIAVSMTVVSFFSLHCLIVFSLHWGTARLNELFLNGENNVSLKGKTE